MYIYIYLHRYLVTLSFPGREGGGCGIVCEEEEKALRCGVRLLCAWMCDCELGSGVCALKVWNSQIVCFGKRVVAVVLFRAALSLYQSLYTVSRLFTPVASLYARVSRRSLYVRVSRRSLYARVSRCSLYVRVSRCSLYARVSRRSL